MNNKEKLISFFSSIISVHVMVVILFSQSSLIMLTKKYCHKLSLIVLKTVRGEGLKHS